MTLLLSNEDAEKLVTMPDCVEVLEQTYRELALGHAANPTRTDALSPTNLPNSYYQLKLTGGLIPSLGVSALRVNSDIGAVIGNRQVKQAMAPGKRYTGLVLLFSSHTTEPLAIFPDGVLQRMRVGAASALGAKYMARPDSATVGLIGVGWQAGSQVMAITTTHKIKLIRCYGPTREKRESFAREMTERTGVEVRPVNSTEEAVKDADIVLSATNSHEHVFFERWMKPGMHFGTIRGADVEPAVVLRADVVAIHDRTKGVFVSTHGLEVPKGRHAIPEVQNIVDKAPTLPELIFGSAKGRTSPEQKTCFLNLVGIGLQFAAVGSVLYRKAVEAGAGRELPTEWFTEDVVP